MGSRGAAGGSQPRGGRKPRRRRFADTLLPCRAAYTAVGKATAVMPLVAIALLVPLDVNAQASPQEGAGGDYVELLKQQEAFMSMTEAEQRVYIQRAVDFINSDDPYESARNKLLQELSTATLELQSR